MDIIVTTEGKEARHWHLSKRSLVIGTDELGKRAFLTTLVTGFAGNLKEHFIVNGRAIEKNDYYFLFAAGLDTIEPELKLGAKSVLKKEITKTVQDHLLDWQTAFDYQTLKELIDQALIPLVTYDSNLAIRFEPELADLIQRSLHITYQASTVEVLTFGQQRLMLFNYLRQQARMLGNQAIICIDEFDLGLTEYERLVVLQQFAALQQELDCYIILTSIRLKYHEQYETKFMYDALCLQKITDFICPYTFIAYCEQQSASDIQNYLTDSEVTRYMIKSLTLDIQQIVFDYFYAAVSYERFIQVYGEIDPIAENFIKSQIMLTKIE